MNKSNKTAEKDDLTKKVYKAVKRPMSSEEKREQRISYVLSTVGKFDDETRKEVEQVVDEVYG